MRDMRLCAGHVFLLGSYGFCSDCGTLQRIIRDHAGLMNAAGVLPYLLSFLGIGLSRKASAP